MPTAIVCPKCGSGSLARSHRKKWFERVASEMGVFPFRCGKCGHRFLGYDGEALWMDHVERRAWVTSTRVFWFAVMSVSIALLVYLFRSGR